MANLGFYKKISPYGAILISELGSSGQTRTGNLEVNSFLLHH